MSSNITRKTGSATLVMSIFTKPSSLQPVYLSGFSAVRFGIRPNSIVFASDYVSAFLINYKDTFKFKANVSILNKLGTKLFTKEYLGTFGNGIEENHFSLMPCAVLLSPENGYLYRGKLTLLCEIEVIDDERENQKNRMGSNLAENLKSLLSDDKFADATLLVGGKEFCVHKAILAARSPVFAAMFGHDFEEKRLNKAIITNMEQDVCEEMLRFIYTDKVKSLDPYKAMGLLVAADKYQLDSLKTIAEQYMCNTLSVESVANVLILADLHQATALKSKCIEYITANSATVMSTKGWKMLNSRADLLMELFCKISSKSF